MNLFKNYSLTIQLFKIIQLFTITMALADRIVCIKY